MDVSSRFERSVVVFLTVSLAANAWLFVTAPSRSEVGPGVQRPIPLHSEPLVRRPGGTSTRAVLEQFISAGRQGQVGSQPCGSTALALQAEIQRARADLDRVLPTKTVFASGTSSPEVTRRFQGTIDQLVGGHGQTIAAHNFDCTDRACRLSMLLEGEDASWMDDLRGRLLRTHRNMPLLAFTNGGDMVERPGQSPLAQLDVYFKVDPIDKMQGEEAAQAQMLLRAFEATTPPPEQKGP
jgi:hypothetical protein